MANRKTPQVKRFLVSNIAKKKSLRVCLEIADDELSRMRGLMFRPEIIPMLFIFGSRGLFPIHSYFVKAEFDAIYLSEEGAVTEMFRKIPPNTALVSPKKQASFLLELPAEVTDALSIEAGDRISWKEVA